MDHVQGITLWPLQVWGKCLKVPAARLVIAHYSLTHCIGALLTLAANQFTTSFTISEPRLNLK